MLQRNQPATLLPPENNLVASLFSDWNNFGVCCGATLYAFTSLYHGDKVANDGNAMLTIPLNHTPMKNGKKCLNTSKTSCQMILHFYRIMWVAYLEN